MGGTQAESATVSNNIAVSCLLSRRVNPTQKIIENQDHKCSTEDAYKFLEIATTPWMRKKYYHRLLDASNTNKIHLQNESTIVSTGRYLLV